MSKETRDALQRVATILTVIVVISIGQIILTFMKPAAPVYIQRAATIEECNAMEAAGIHCLLGETAVLDVAPQ